MLAGCADLLSAEIVARRASGIATLADLRGKKVGTPANTSAQYYLVKALRSAVAASEVTVVTMAVPDMAAAMTKGSVDAVSGWEPGAHDAIAALGAGAIGVQAARALPRVVRPQHDDCGADRSRPAARARRQRPRDD